MNTLTHTTSGQLYWVSVDGEKQFAPLFILPASIQANSFIGVTSGLWTIHPLIAKVLPGH